MSIVYEDKLLKYPNGTRFVLDACALVDVSKNVEVQTLVQKMIDNGYELCTVAPAWVEYLRVAETHAERKVLRDLLIALDIKCLENVQSDLYSEDGALFQLVMRHCKVNNPSFVDLLLLFVAYKDPKALLVTSNFKDVPVEVFDLKETITFSKDGKNFRVIGAYGINRDSFNEKTAHIKK